jgi:hypothetical protein
MRSRSSASLGATLSNVPSAQNLLENALEINKSKLFTDKKSAFSGSLSTER